MQIAAREDLHNTQVQILWSRSFLPAPQPRRGPHVCRTGLIDSTIYRFEVFAQHTRRIGQQRHGVHITTTLIAHREKLRPRDLNGEMILLMQQLNKPGAPFSTNSNAVVHSDFDVGFNRSASGHQLSRPLTSSVNAKPFTNDRVRRMRMIILSVIRREHVLSAIEEIRRTGVPRERRAKKYDLVFGDLRLPPKYVLSIAAKMATGSELPADVFSGCDEANSYLRDLGFDVRLRRVDWSRAECYLAVWLYDRFDCDRDVNKSALYREVSEITGRSVKSVEWKVQNVSACDPRTREEKPIAPAVNTQRLLSDVFREYWADRVSARNRYAEILQELTFEPQTPEDPRLPSGNLLIEEGALGFQESFRRQRSRKLIEFARELFRKADPGGILRCASCGFSTPSLHYS